MKKYFLFLILTFILFSCKKTTKLNDNEYNTTEKEIPNLSSRNDNNIGQAKITLVLHSRWINFRQDCWPGYWYCWEINRVGNSNSYIKVNEEEKLVTFGIDNSINSEYHKSFINGSNFNFQQDTLKKEIVKTMIGLEREIILKQGAYHFDNINGILTMNIPYTIKD